MSSIYGVEDAPWVLEWAGNKMEKGVWVQGVREVHLIDTIIAR